MNLCLDLELNMGNYSRISLVEKANIGPNKKKLCLLGLSFSLDPVIQADTPNKQYCDFSRDSVAFETDRDMSI